MSDPTRSSAQSQEAPALSGSDDAAARQARDVIAFGAETGRVLSDGRIVGRREPYAKVFPSSRVVKRAVGVTAWAILEDIALDADIDDQGRLVARTDVRRIAENLGLNKQTVSTHLKKLRQHGFAHWKQENSDGFGGSLYILDPSACIERFTVTPTDEPQRGRRRPRPKISDTRRAASENLGHGGSGPDEPGPDEPGLQQEDVVVSRPTDEEQQHQDQPQSHQADRPQTDTSGSSDLVAQLVERGVTQAVATQLVAAHPAERIRAALYAVRTKRPKRPAGWLVAAITKDWALEPAPPDRQQPSAGPAQADSRPDATMLAFEQAVDTALAGLTLEEQAALAETARSTVAGRFTAAGRIDPNLLDKPVAATLVRTELRLLVAKRCDIPIPGAYEPESTTDTPSESQ